MCAVLYNAYPSTCLSIRRSVCLSVCQSVHLSRCACVICMCVCSRVTYTSVTPTRRCWAADSRPRTAPSIWLHAVQRQRPGRAFSTPLESPTPSFRSSPRQKKKNHHPLIATTRAPRRDATWKRFKPGPWYSRIRGSSTILPQISLCIFFFFFIFLYSSYSKKNIETRFKFLIRIKCVW